MSDYKRKIAIVSDHDGNLIPTEQIFGDDSTVVSDLCMHIFHDALFHDHFNYTGCYRSASRPKISYFKKTPVGIKSYRQAIEDWKTENPVEFQKEKASEEAWNATAKDRFAQLFRLAKKHHVHLQWCGTSPYYVRKDNEEKRGPNTPDKWIIIQDTQRFAQICCM